MPVADLVFQRTIDLPPVIVWDALVDPDLLAGWLGEVRAVPDEPSANRNDAPRSPRVFELLWPGAGARPSTTGSVTVFEAPRQLRVETDNRGRIEFTLESIPGGLRGSSTELELRVGSGIEPAFATAVRDEWQTSLDRLERLLHGHPVDWANVDEQSDGTTGVGGTSGRSVNSPR
ncbi:MAG: SRPBCC family protein [Actinomycetota bacterium]